MGEYTSGNPAEELRKTIDSVFNVMERIKRESPSVSYVLRNSLGTEKIITKVKKLESVKNLLQIMKLVETRKDIFPENSVYIEYFPTMTQEVVNLPRSIYDKNSDVPIYPQQTLLTLTGISSALDQAIKHFPEQPVNNYISFLNELRERVINDKSLSADLQEFIFTRIRDIEKALMNPGIDSDKDIELASKELSIGMEAAAEKTTSSENKKFFSIVKEECAKWTVRIIFAAVGMAGNWAMGAIAEHLPEPFQKIGSTLPNLLPLPSGTSHQENIDEPEHQDPASVAPE